MISFPWKLWRNHGNPLQPNGYWGLAAANHDDETIAVSMKYYAYGQLSRYIRPGYTIIGTNKTGTTLAAYDKTSRK